MDQRPLVGEFHQKLLPLRTETERWAWTLGRQQTCLFAAVNQWQGKTEVDQPPLVRISWRYSVSDTISKWKISAKGHVA